MKTTHRLFLSACLLCAPLAAMADVVYEPLIVDSGFNRDCIAERYPIGNSAVSYLLSSGTTYCFGTKSVIDSVNTHYSWFDSRPEDFAIAKESGWPDDFTNDSNNRIIRCIMDAADSALYRDVFWQLAPYNEANVLTLRPDGNNQPIGTLRFKKVGCYNRLFFLTVSAKQGTPPSARRVLATVYYTDGDTTKAVFNLAEGLGGQEGHKVCMTNTYEGYFNKNTSAYTSGKGKGCASVFDIKLDSTKLVHRIVFENDVEKSAAIILGVTGRTADIAAPDEANVEVNNIEQNSFEACWEAIADAASYRLDVAEDPDFQHILADYNNLVVSGTTCQEVAGLIANNDYYWRVRSENSQGGQSASSAPSRVRTAAAGGTATFESDEEDEDIEDDLSSWLSTSVPTIDIHRTLYRDGYFNTLCLPFDLDAAAIAASPIAGGELYEFVSAEKNGEQLNIEILPANRIDAGVPYLIRWPNTNDIIPTPLTFRNVTIKRNTGLSVGNPNDIRFIGHIGMYQIPREDHYNLFVGEENVLYWPDETDSKMMGYRAYFAIPHETSPGVPLRRGTPAFLVERRDTPTAIEEEQIDRAQYIKKLENGTFYILKDGVKYNAQGQIVK